MQDDEEGKERFRALLDVPVKQLRDDNRVTQAADRKQLGHALQDRKHKRLDRPAQARDSGGG